jgi:hypothetical protein
MRSESVWKGRPSPDTGSLSGPETRGQARAGSPHLRPMGYPEPNTRPEGDCQGECTIFFTRHEPSCE